jgi:hypothetical protein
MIGLTMVAAYHMYYDYVTGADWVRLVLLFFAYFIPINVLSYIRMRIADPYNPRWYKPKTPKPQAKKPAKPMPQPAAASQEPIPMAPKDAQKPRERNFAAPPTVEALKPDLASVRPSMPSRLRKFVAKGEEAIQSPKK